LPVLQLLSRAGCGLCDEMHADLVALADELELPPLAIVDVDSDPTLQRRFGLKIPVLLLHGQVVCFGKLDEAELRRHLRGGREK
jgi:hypothetical protein